MTISGSVFYMYGKQASIESAFIRSQKTEVNQSNDGVLLDSVLGDYDSIDLQEQPKAQTDPTNIDTPETQQQVSSPVAISKNEVYALINSYRKQHGLSEVSIDERLETSSMNKAQDMVKNNYFEHKNPWGFINGAGYTFSYAAENLAINYYSSDSLVRGWQNSPSHNQALLDERNQHMGLSYICGVSVTQHQNTCLAVIHFAREQK